MPAHLLRGSSLLAVTASVALAACATEPLPVPPPADAFYFPTGIAHVDSATGPGVLYVTSSNFDRRFDRGALTAVDLAKLLVPAENQPALPPLGGSIANGVFSVAQIENLQLAPENVAYVNTFTGQLGVLATTPGSARLFVPTREAGSILNIVDAAGPVLTCLGGGNDCRGEKMPSALSLQQGIDPVNRRVPDGLELFGVTVVQADDDIVGTGVAAGTAFVTHLAAVEPLEETNVEGEGREHFFIRVNPGAENYSATFPDDYFSLGLGAGNAVAVGQKYVYVAGRVFSPTQRTSLVRLVDPLTGQVLGAGLEGPYAADEARGIALSPDEKRLYLSTRAPDSLLIVDLQGAETGAVPSLRIAASVFLPEGAGPVKVIDRPGRGNLVVVTSQNAGVVSIYDEAAGQTVAAVSGVGEQPFDVAVDVDPNGVANSARLYVSNFSDGRVAVVDIPNLDLPAEARVVAYLGRSQECLTNEQDDVPCPGEEAK